MDNTISCVSKDKCTGCGACYNKCPKDAIRMEYDEEGFLFPLIEEEKCIHCGICKRVCPIEKEKRSIYKQKYYAVWTEQEIEKNSSSGGMFTLLARYIISLKGSVCGCRYSDDYRYAYHTIIQSEDELRQLRKSKYIQSEIREVYRGVEKLLKQEKWILFTGVPCQVAGLYSFLGRDYKTLLTADLICHGVPSLLAYNKFLEENSQGREIEFVDFRDKNIVPWGTIEYIKFKDSTYHYNDIDRGTWYKAFLSGLSTRKSCGTCEYANPNRQGDFTLGDFWGIREICPECAEVNKNNGVSLVIVNSDKGHNFYKRIVRQAQYREIEKEVVLETAKTKNGNLLHATPSHYARSRFFEMLLKEDFSQACRKALYARYDIGVVGWWYNLNYGGALSYYALHQVLRKMGFSVLMIAKTSEDANYKPDKNSIPYRFALKYYYISRNHSKYSMQGLNEHCNIFISGSDQLFNPVLWQWSGPEYFLHFVNSDNKKISYASSFGNEFRQIGHLTEKMAYWVKRFDAMSVRESYGVDIAKKVYGVDVQKVLDPVFLCNLKEYEDLIEQSDVKTKEHYFVNFILDPCEEKRDIVYYVESKLRCDYINLINADHIEENKIKMNMKNVMADADIEDWLKYYYYSEFVVTDSFHGTCFAIIFHKPFISIANRERGENRFISLLEEFGLLDRLVYSLDDIKAKGNLFDDIDYGKVDAIWKEKKDISVKWLHKAITEPKNVYQMSDFQLLDRRIEELEKRIDRLSKKG